MSRISKFFLVDCSKANQCCDKAQYKDASIGEKLKLTLHMAFCKACREYTRRNKKLTQILKKSKLESCPEAKKKQWKEQINRERVRDNA